MMCMHQASLERAMLPTATELPTVEDTPVRAATEEVVIFTSEDDMERSLNYIFAPEQDLKPSGARGTTLSFWIFYRD